MTRALIGYTGFVGGNLASGGGYSALFNSQNVGEMRGRHFAEIVCAGVASAKWLANRDPEADRRAIAALTDVLETVVADRFVLISTIDVYPVTDSGENEDAALAGRANHAYGQHRLALEEWVRDRFASARIVRLPALFGPGLKKNALYDLLTGNMIDRINPAATFQWYDVTRLAADLALVARHDLRLVNLFTAPLAMADIIDRLFPGAPIAAAAEPAPHYRLTTKHAALFGGAGGFIADAPACLAAIAAFVARCRSGAR